MTGARSSIATLLVAVPLPARRTRAAPEVPQLINLTVEADDRLLLTVSDAATNNPGKFYRIKMTAP